MLKGAFKLHSLAEKTKEAIGVRNKDWRKPYFVAVCGGIGCGKTTFSNKLIDSLGSDIAVILNEEDYLKDSRDLFKLNREIINPQLYMNKPDLIEFDLLKEHLDSLNSGAAVPIPLYDYKNMRRIDIKKVVSPQPIIIVEGTFLYLQREIENYFHKMIFIDAPEEVRFERIKQKMLNSGRNKPTLDDNINSEAITTLQTIHKNFIEPCKAKANMVISGEEPFEPIIVDFCRDLIQHILFK